MSWTDERVGLLEKLWTEGKSAAEIAKTLGEGVTRNAVIGKAHRMGLSGRPSPIKKKKSEKTATVAKAPKAAVPPKAEVIVSAPMEPQKRSENGVSIMELTDRICKWPIGDPRHDDFHFCGEASPPGTPYCPEHAAAAYQTSSRGRTKAANQSDEAAVATEKTAEAQEEKSAA